MKKQVNVGFIGAGSFISGYHLLTVRDSEIMRIRAIADISEETLALHQKNLELDYVTTDYKKVLEDPEIDMVIIGTKHDLHAQLIKESLAAGKWVFCEKPMSQDNKESQEVIDVLNKSKGKLAIGFNRRFAPAHQDMKRLIQSVKRPWFLYYRQMCPYVSKAKFYYTQPHILYEGTHILDLVCWLFDDIPVRVNMTGDFTDNSIQLEFEDGSQVLFLCGTMSSFLYWKEQLEFCAEHHAINIADMVDMRVRGWEGEFDRLYSPYLDEKKEEVFKYGFDFYDTLRSELIYRQTDFINQYNIPIEHVKRPSPNPLPYDIEKYDKSNPELQIFFPDKGWRQSLEHFAECFLTGKEPENASGVDGALSTELAVALLKSLELGQRVEFKSQFVTKK